MAKNTKLTSIELVTNVKDNGEVETKTFYRPNFTPLSKLEFIDGKIQEMNKVETEYESMKITAEVIAFLFNNQFTVDDILNGIDLVDAGNVFEEHIGSVIQGASEDKEEKEQKANLEKVTK
ncbi:phage tail assembly chaperone G [Staphylococcus xylosus]|uniref:phage tail assembly chaperone G n=1 Tax=Staphylococcus xylosus TaxID=1288 RepID=UPI0035F5C209